MAFGSNGEPAPHLQRFLALLIDAVLVGLISIAGVAAWFLMGDMTGMLIMGALVLVAAVYEPYFVAAKGATPGKSACSINLHKSFAHTLWVGRQTSWMVRSRTPITP